MKLRPAVVSFEINDKGEMIPLETTMAGIMGDNKPNAAIEEKVNSSWKPGKVRPSKRYGKI